MFCERPSLLDFLPQAKPKEMQAARDLSESRKLPLAAGDLVTLVDHRWVAGDGDLKHTQWLFVRMKQRLQSNGCFPVFVSGCQDSEYDMMHSWINLVVSRVAGFVFNKITAISGNNVSTNKRHAKKTTSAKSTIVYQVRLTCNI